MTIAEDLKEWRDITVTNFLGGQVLDSDSELLDNTQVLKATNLVYRDKLFQRDTGYTPFLAAVRGTPQRHITYKARNGVIVEVLVTTLTVYRNINSQWRYVSNGVDTTLSAGEPTAETAIAVADITGFSDNDFIGIVLDSGQMHLTTINGAPAAGVITIDDPLPSAVGAGKALIKAPVLTGSAEKHVTAVPIPWGDYLVFTNGVNPLQYYDPTTDVVTEVPNLPSGGGLVCQTLALYDNSIVIANLLEGGTLYPYRYRYCAKGDLTAWASLDAGYTDLLDVESHILQLLKLGPFLIAYRDKSVNRIGLSSNPLRRFDTDTAVTGIGIFSNYGAVDLTDKHLVWGNDGIYWYVGGFSAEPIPCPVYNALFGVGGELAEDTRNRAFALLLKKKNEVLFVYQASGGSAPNKAARFHLSYETQPWTTRSFVDTFTGFGSRVSGDSFDWSELTGDWIDQIGDWASYNISGNIEQVTLCCKSQLQVMTYDYVAATDDGVAIPVVFETKDYAHPDYMLRHDFLDIFLKGGTVTVEYSTDKGASWKMLGTVIGSTVMKRYRLFKQFTDRFFRYRFSTSNAVTFIAKHVRYKYEFEW